MMNIIKVLLLLNTVESYDRSDFGKCFIRPPDMPQSSIDEFEKEIEKANELELEMIIMGDIKIDFTGSRLNNKWGNRLLTQSVVQLIDSPTRITSTSSSIIDHVYSYHPENIVETNVPKIALCDYYPEIAVKVPQGRCKTFLKIFQYNCSSDKRKWICCSGFEDVNDTCIECKVGFFSHAGETCERCHDGFYGYKCALSCLCLPTERCDHVYGCVEVVITTETGTTEDHYDGSNREEHIFMSLLGLIVLSLLIFTLTCICWKYELSCKKRERRSVHAVSTHPNESGNNQQLVEIHDYDEVDDGFLNRESSLNDKHDVRSSGSSTGGSGICGVDSDGYLNPYNALKSVEITMGQGTSSKHSSTETSYAQAQENTVYFQTSE